jgi:hypothetical protein
MGHPRLRDGRDVVAVDKLAKVTEQGFDSVLWRRDEIGPER